MQGGLTCLLLWEPDQPSVPISVGWLIALLVATNQAGATGTETTQAASEPAAFFATLTLVASPRAGSVSSSAALA